MADLDWLPLTIAALSLGTAIALAILAVPVVSSLVRDRRAS